MVQSLRAGFCKVSDKDAIRHYLGSGFRVQSLGF